jgi:hypothetical protein
MNPTLVRKWFVLSALLTGTTLQLSACQQELSLFGLRTLFSSFFLPLNQSLLLITELLIQITQGLTPGII